MGYLTIYACDTFANEARTLRDLKYHLVDTLDQLRTIIEHAHLIDLLEILMWFTLCILYQIGLIKRLIFKVF
jgi:hypothetical protein